jgi:predicted RNase H-like nuclease (RuvC/YqgF family)
MRRNSLEWGYAADEESYDAFAEPVTTKSVMAWVLQLHVVLRGRFGELPGADVRSVLHEAIQRGLDERKGDAEEMVGVMMDEIGSTVNDVDTGTEHSRAIKVEDEVSDFDEKKFVDFDVQMIEDDDVDLSVFDEVGKVDGKKIRKVDEEKIKKVDEEFGDDIDDDMLLDM